MKKYRFASCVRKACADPNRDNLVLKKAKRILFVFVLAISSTSLFSTTITLVHSNDTHGRFVPYSRTDRGQERLIGGMEAVSHYLNQIRTQIRMCWSSIRAIL